MHDELGITVTSSCCRLGTVARAPQSPQERDGVSGHPPACTGSLRGRLRSLPQARVAPLVEAVAHSAEEDASVAPVGRGRVPAVDVVLRVGVALHGRRRLCRHEETKGALLGLCARGLCEAVCRNSYLLRMRQFQKNMKLVTHELEKHRELCGLVYWCCCRSFTIGKSITTTPAPARPHDRLDTILHSQVSGS